MPRTLTVFFPVLVLLTCCQIKGNRENENEGGGRENTGSQAEKKEGGAHINCFVYHRFGNDRYPSTNISLERFKGHLQFLKEENYTVLTLGEALQRMGERREEMGKTAVLTVDDGYSSILSGAVPLLKKYGFSATIFINTDQIGNKNTLTWPEVKDLQKKGFEIGNHSHSHEHFLDHPRLEIKSAFRKDLEKAEAIFRDRLGQVPSLYAYPYGEYTQEMKEVLRDKGYEAAVAQRSGVIHAGGDRYALPRFPMTSHYGKIEKFREKAGMHPLGVIKEKPAEVLLSSDQPPRLEVTIDNPELSAEGIQCFVDGARNCETRILKRDPLKLEVQGTKAFSDRRTLYTLTAPSKDGKRWHWFSRLWVNPEKGE